MLSRRCLQDNITLGTLDEGNNLPLLGWWYREVIETCLYIRHEHLPLLFGNVEVHMGIPHGTPAILLGTPSRPADQFGDEVLEPSPGHPMMRFIDLRIGVQPRIVHDAVNQVIDDGSNRIDAPKPVIERFAQFIAVCRRSKIGAIGMRKPRRGSRLCRR
jgi:hypothetical protein